MTEFSKQMKTKRMEKNIYLLDFAKKTKISAVRLANIECGAKPSQEEELKIKRVLGI